MDFSEYVSERRTTLVRTVVLMGCPQPDAEDVVQSALLKCHRHWRRVQRAEQPEAYVHTILLNTLRDTRNRKWHGELPHEVLPEVPPDAAATPDAATGIAVRHALAGLEPAQREVLVLRYYAGLSEREIAELLRIKPGTVKSRASRGLAHLSAELRSTDVH